MFVRNRYRGKASDYMLLTVRVVTIDLVGQYYICLILSILPLSFMWKSTIEQERETQDAGAYLDREEPLFGAWFRTRLLRRWKTGNKPMYNDVHRSAHPGALTRDKVRIFDLLAIRASSQDIRLPSTTLVRLQQRRSTIVPSIHPMALFLPRKKSGSGSLSVITSAKTQTWCCGLISVQAPHRAKLAAGFGQACSFSYLLTEST
jgi:hypothetical protein